MTNRAATAHITNAAFARRKAAQADHSDMVSEAYRHLADLIANDPALAVLGEFELDRAKRNADEYADDADDLRGIALRAGFDPDMGR